MLTHTRTPKILCAMALLSGLLIASAPAPGAERRGPTVTLRQLNAVVAGHTWYVQGRLRGTGARADKTVVIEWRKAGNWKRVGVKRHVDDGRYKMAFTSGRAGVSQLRAVVYRGARRLDKSPTRALTVLADTPNVTPQPPAQPGEAGIRSNLNLVGGTQTMPQFLDAVLADVHAYWARIWASAGWAAPTVGHYWPLQGETVYHACWASDGQGGLIPPGSYVDDNAAYYCSANDYIILTQHIATQLWLGALNYSGVPDQAAGDFSVAYAIAHEYGHNIQAELGWHKVEVPTVNRELHADCLAGNWMNSAYYSGALQAGDVEEALGAARRVGDHWLFGGNHGTPDQRETAVLHGFNTGDPSQCEAIIRQW